MDSKKNKNHIKKTNFFPTKLTLAEKYPGVTTIKSNSVMKHINNDKGRSEVPRRPGAYNLKDRRGRTIYTGSTNNLRRRIAEHSRDPTKHFSSFTVSSTRKEKKSK